MNLATAEEFHQEIARLALQCERLAVKHDILETRLEIAMQRGPRTKEAATMNETNERSVASTGSVANGWSEELVSVVADYRLEWRQPEGRQDAMALLMRTTGGGGGMEGGHHGPYSAIPVGTPRLSQPTLTDAERTLLGRLACEADHPRAWTNRALTADDRATLRGLLERLK